MRKILTNIKIIAIVIILIIGKPELGLSQKPIKIGGSRWGIALGNTNIRNNDKRYFYNGIKINVIDSYRISEINGLNLGLLYTNCFAVNGISISPISKMLTLNGLNLGLLYTNISYINGITISAINNTKIINGLQLGLKNNIRTSNTLGSCSEGGCKSHPSHAFQIGLLNNNYSTLFGFQLGLYNTSYSHLGLQLGLYNRNDYQSGIGIGLINKCKSQTIFGGINEIIPCGMNKGIYLGLINISNYFEGIECGVINISHISDTYDDLCRKSRRTYHLFGLQLGIVNYCESSNVVQIGIINIIPQNKWFAKIVPLANFRFVKR